ncbi:Protein CBG22579 [Caenorhabditis briggsae]|uniref:Protein CBG22579 n=1 Tax=Caenorhabditis briggsae TaxID=6238 RepID=A8Y2M2_CAEBR|nr:Protein CBG22579 [Caenorhabditis briggsae]CAP39146.1 Protein CBG22579 [Caenorhabditis briggsae]
MDGAEAPDEEFVEEFLKEIFNSKISIEQAHRELCRLLLGNVSGTEYVAQQFGRRVENYDDNLLTRYPITKVREFYEKFAMEKFEDFRDRSLKMLENLEDVVQLMSIRRISVKISSLANWFKIVNIKKLKFTLCCIENEQWIRIDITEKPEDPEKKEDEPEPVLTSILYKQNLNDVHVEYGTGNASVLKDCDHRKVAIFDLVFLLQALSETLEDLEFSISPYLLTCPAKYPDLQAYSLIGSILNDYDPPPQFPVRRLSFMFTRFHSTNNFNWEKREEDTDEVAHILKYLDPGTLNWLSFRIWNDKMVQKGMKGAQLMFHPNLRGLEQWKNAYVLDIRDEFVAKDWKLCDEFLVILMASLLKEDIEKGVKRFWLRLPFGREIEPTDLPPTPPTDSRPFSCICASTCLHTQHCILRQTAFTKCLICREMKCFVLRNSYFYAQMHEIGRCAGLSVSCRLSVGGRSKIEMEAFLLPAKYFTRNPPRSICIIHVNQELDLEEIQELYPSAFNFEPGNIRILKESGELTVSLTFANHTLTVASYKTLLDPTIYRKHLLEMFNERTSISKAHERMCQWIRRGEKPIAIGQVGPKEIHYQYRIRPVPGGFYYAEPAVIASENISLLYPISSVKKFYDEFAEAFLARVDNTAAEVEGDPVLDTVDDILQFMFCRRLSWQLYGITKAYMFQLDVVSFTFSHEEILLGLKTGNCGLGWVKYTPEGPNVCMSFSSERSFEARICERYRSTIHNVNLNLIAVTDLEFILRRLSKPLDELKFMIKPFVLRSNEPIRFPDLSVYGMIDAALQGLEIHNPRFEKDINPNFDDIQEDYKRTKRLLQVGHLHFTFTRAKLFENPQNLEYEDSQELLKILKHLERKNLKSLTLRVWDDRQLLKKLGNRVTVLPQLFVGRCVRTTKHWMRLNTLDIDDELILRNWNFLAHLKTVVVWELSIRDVRNALRRFEKVIPVTGYTIRPRRKGDLNEFRTYFLEKLREPNPDTTSITIQQEAEKDQLIEMRVELDEGKNTVATVTATVQLN